MQAYAGQAKESNSATGELHQREELDRHSHIRCVPTFWHMNRRTVWFENYSRNKCFPQYFTHRSTHYIEPAVHLPTRFNNCHPPLWLPPNCFKIQLTLESTQKSTRFWTSPSPLLWSDSLFQCTPPTWCYAARAPTLCSAPSWRPPCWGTTMSKNSTWSRSAEDPCSKA